MSKLQSFHATFESTLLVSATYSLQRMLELKFRSGAVYRYFEVPPAVVQGLLVAESKGAFFNRHVRNRFPYRRLI